MRKILFTISALGLGFGALAQNQKDRAQDLQLNSIITAVPFLNSTPDSRAGAMGDVGVSTTADANSIHWNPAKLAFNQADAGLSFSYVPWLRALVNDMNLVYLTGFKKINDKSAVGGSFRFFSLGSITFTDDQGNVIRDFTPSEFALDGAYSLKLSDNFSTGVALRYVHSNLTGGSVVQGQDTKPGNSVAFDFSGFFQSNKFDLGGKNAFVTSGIAITNVGNKMTYTNNQEEDFIPTNLRLGSTLNMELDKYNAISFSLEANKLLVPTPGGSLDPDADSTITNVSPTKAIFGSFSDAPQGGKEELSEINLSFGTEYRYNNQLAFRLGYFYEAPTKGNRQYITMGAGFKYQTLNIDLSYLLSTSGPNNPLANTLRFTLGLDLGKKSTNDTPDVQ